MVQNNSGFFVIFPDSKLDAEGRQPKPPSNWIELVTENEKRS